MPTVHMKLGNLVGFSASTNLNSLADKQAKVIGVVDNTSLNYPNAYVSLSFAATSNLAADGAIEIYFSPCVDTVNDVWTDNISSHATANIAASIYNSKLLSPSIKAMYGMGGKNIRYVINDLAKEVGDLPPKFMIIVYNKSGQALKSSGHRAVYQLRSYTI